MYALMRNWIKWKSHKRFIDIDGKVCVAYYIASQYCGTDKVYVIEATSADRSTFHRSKLPNKP